MILQKQLKKHLRDDLSRAHIIVKGFVQGVGFRFFVEDVAPKLNLKGYVLNVSGGNVKVEVEGNKDNIDQLIKLLKQGPSAGHVTEVIVSWENYLGNFSKFDIKY